MNLGDLSLCGVMVGVMYGGIKYLKYSERLALEEFQAKEKSKLKELEAQKEEREKAKEEYQVWLNSLDGKMTTLLLRYVKFAQTVPTKHLFELFQEIWKVYLHHLPEQFESLPGGYKAEITETMIQAGQSQMVHVLMHNKIVKMDLVDLNFDHWYSVQRLGLKVEAKSITRTFSSFHKAAVSVVNTAT